MWILGQVDLVRIDLVGVLLGVPRQPMSANISAELVSYILLRNIANAILVCVDEHIFALGRKRVLEALLAVEFRVDHLG